MADVSDQNSKPVEDGEGVSWAEPEEETQAEEAGLLESREVVAPLTRDALNSEELKVPDQERSGRLANDGTLYRASTTLRPHRPPLTRL